MGTVSLKTIKAAAAQLKAYVKNADRNKDGVVTAQELKNAGYSSGAMYPFRTAALSMLNATAKGATQAKLADVKKAIDSTVKQIGTRDYDKDGFIEAGAELTSVEADKPLGALYNFAPTSAVSGYGGYSRGESLNELLSHIGPGSTQNGYTDPAQVPASLKSYVLQATGTTTLADAFAKAGGNIQVRKFRDLRTDELHALISWNGDNAGALFATRRKEMTGTLTNMFVMAT